jgi:hypothetical protein
MKKCGSVDSLPILKPISGISSSVLEPWHLSCLLAAEDLSLSYDIFLTNHEAGAETPRVLTMLSFASKLTP